MRNIWVLKFGLIACVGVVPLALICAPLRHVPLWWIAVDSSFGVFGAIPLYLAFRLTRRLEADAARPKPPEVVASGPADQSATA